MAADVDFPPCMLLRHMLEQLLPRGHRQVRGAACTCIFAALGAQAGEEGMMHAGMRMCMLSRLQAVGGMYLQRHLLLAW